MLHTKFRENRGLPVSGEEDFWRIFTIYGPGGHLGHVTQMPRTNFRSPYPRRLHIKFGFDWPSGFGEEDVWNCERRTTDDGRTTDGRTPDHWYTISSPLSLWLRWAKNCSIHNHVNHSLTIHILTWDTRGYQKTYVCSRKLWFLNYLDLNSFRSTHLPHFSQNDGW